MKPFIKKENTIPFDVPTSMLLCTSLQDLDYHLYQHLQLPSSSMSEIEKRPCFDLHFPYGTNCYSSSSSNFDFYERKPYAAHHQHYDNSHIDTTLPLITNFQESNAVDNFVAQDEVSRVHGNDHRENVEKKNLNLVKGQWTTEEDSLLIRLVDQYGITNWSHIAQMLPGRIGKQCRQRWLNHLKPDIKKDTWSEEEDKVLIEAHVEIGNKWAEIAKRLPGRTDNSIKNRWYTTKRKKISKLSLYTKNPEGTLLQEYMFLFSQRDTWSEEEDKVLIGAHAEIGNKWAEIAKRLPGRTANSIKKRWYATKRRKISKRSFNTKNPEEGTLLQEYIKSLKT